MDTNFTFSNPVIKDYFEGRTEIAPIGELVYLHSHPLITPNFLTELEQITLQAGHIMTKKNLQGKPLQDMIEIGTKIGQTLPNLTYENAPGVVAELRKLYKLSKSLIETLG